MGSELNRARTAAIVRSLGSGPEPQSHSISAVDPDRLPIATQSLPGRPEISTEEVEEESGSGSENTEQERLDAAHAKAVARTAAERRKRDIARGYGIPPTPGEAFDPTTSEASIPSWAERFVPFQRYRDLAKEGGVLEEYDEPRIHGLYDYDFAPTAELREPVVDYIQYEPKEDDVL